MMQMTHKRTTPKVFKHAQELRHNPTPAEARLWSHLRSHRGDGPSFRRQHAIGNYIADFCCPSRMLIIELDGSQHLEQDKYDADRTADLEAKGYRVLRFWNDEVMNDIEGVMSVVLEAME
jgi:very-short-patch-repair endonuclease